MTTHVPPPREVPDEPFVTAAGARAALECLGAKGLPDDLTHGQLIGMLLAVAETSARYDHDRADVNEFHDGYTLALIAMAPPDEPIRAAQEWIVLLNDRLNRTALELNEAVEGTGRPFIDVAGPALLAASNILVMLNSDDLDADKAATVLDSADAHLKLARASLGEARKLVRRDLGSPRT